MGITKGDKENYLNLYITLQNKEAIEAIISERVENFKWEFYFKAKKIDIFGQSESGKSIFIENQISQADDRHLKSVVEIIEKAPNDSVVVWGATGFSTDMMKVVSAIIHMMDSKRVEFYAVEINENILPILHKLDSMHVLHVMDNLRLLNDVDVYNDIFDKYVSPCHVDTEKKEYRFERITDRERTNAYIIKELRNRIRFPTIFREKRTLDINKVRYGFGKTGIDVELVFSNKRTESYVSCQFTSLTEDIYQEVARRKKVLERKMGKAVVCDYENKRIVTFVEHFEHKFDKIDQLVAIMEKFIFYLCNYTFYFGTAIMKQMWDRHAEGILELT